MNPINTYLSAAYPLKSIRQNSHNAIGKQQLANDAGVTVATVHKASLGLYSSIPVKLLNHMVRFPVGDADHSAARWEELYQDFIKEELTKLKDQIDKGLMDPDPVAFFIDPKEIPKEFSSFISWRESLSTSQMDFCKTYLLHQAIISKYESGHMKNLPQSLKDRLSFLGLSDEYINAVGKLPISNKDSTYVL